MGEEEEKMHTKYRRRQRPLTELGPHVNHQCKRVTNTHWPSNACASGPVTISDLHVAFRRSESEHNGVTSLDSLGKKNV